MLTNKFQKETRHNTVMSKFTILVKVNVWSEQITIKVNGKTCKNYHYSTL